MITEMNAIQKSTPAVAADSKWNHVVSFKDLSVAYFPDVVPHNASRRLKQWIKDSPKLLAELHRYDWNERRHLLTPLQVRCIIRAFGEP